MPGLVPFLRIAGFIPHGHCYLWKSELVWLHVLSDALIAIAYYSIPLTLLYFVRKRTDLPFNNIFLLFGSFIVACGTTHLMEVWTLWHPTYWLSGTLKVITAAVSIYTAMCLVSLLPKALALPSLAAVNQELEREMGDRQQAEASLKESEERLRLALESAQLGTWDWNILTNQIVWSEEHERLFGLAPGTFDGRYETFEACLHPDDRASLLAAVNRARETQTDYSHEFRVVWADGSIHWIEGKGRFYNSEAGEIIRMLGTVKDIGDRKNAELALQQSAHEFAELYNYAPCGYHSLNETGVFIRINDTELNLLGYDCEEIIGKSFSDFLTPESVPVFQQNFPQFKQRGWVNNLQFQMICKDGSILPVIINAIAVKDAAGNFLMSRSTMLDDTDRKQTEALLKQAKHDLEFRVAERTAELVRVNQQIQQELNERRQVQSALELSQTRFAGILEIASDAIISVDGNQTITLFNQGAEKIFGYKAEEVVGQPLDLLLPQRSVALHRQHVSSFAQSDGGARRMGDRSEIFGRRKDGSEFPAEASISRLKLGTETIFTAILRDITDRKQIDRMKDEFVSVVSHELRTPLTSIHGSLGMLASGLLKPDSDQGKRMLQIAVDSTDRLVRLINDILDIERIESGRVKMEKEFCQVDDLLSEAVNVVQALADKAGVTLSVESLPIQVWADPDRIVQTLTNLLSNAVKFSSPGNTVWLAVQQQFDRILFTIQDQGRGIPADKLDSIFERFQQVDSSDSRNHEGTGLGLAICRSIVQQHDGRIWVESVLNEGSTFFFTLPIQAHQTPLGTGQTASIGAPLVLICDDDPEMSARLKTLLEQQNYRVITATSSQAAVTQATSQQPDVILLDLLIPDLNGWETMAQLKEQPETQNIPIIVCSICTASKTPEAAGCVDWVNQPFNQPFNPPFNESLLLRSLKQALVKSSAQLRALIVEDDLDLAQVLTTLFEQHDIETFHAISGRDAIRLSQQINPDLLVLDLVLPEGDGFTVVDWLRQHNQLRHTPVVVYSAKDLNASERDRLRLGQTEFLSKGQVSIQEFEQRVMALLKQVTRTQEQGNDHKADSGCG